MPEHQVEEEVSEDEVMDQSEVSEESDEEDSYIECLAQNVIDEHADKMMEYVKDPKTPEQLSKNKSIKKFIVQTVRDRVLESFESQLMWLEDPDLIEYLRKYKKAMSSNKDEDPSKAMKRVIKDSDVIDEAVEQLLEDIVEDD